MILRYLCSEHFAAGAKRIVGARWGLEGGKAATFPPALALLPRLLSVSSPRSSAGPSARCKAFAGLRMP